MRGGGSSFDRIFARNPGEASASAGERDKPTVHELFAAAMGDQLPLKDFARMLVELHGVHLTPSAVRLLSSVDAASGRISFAQFQRALNEGGALEAAGQGAGCRTNFEDSASAIIADNCGAPCPPQPQSATKLSTDISSEREAFTKRTQAVQSMQARGAFGGNPVVPTNRVSRDNPLLDRGGGDDKDEGADPYGTRAMAQTATRMYVSGEMDRPGYEKFLDRFGIKMTAESEIRRLIDAHEKAGDGSFTVFTKALQRELARAEAAGAGA